MSLYEIGVDHQFTAFHSVKLADGCWEPRHEHVWHVTASFRSEKLDGRGMIVDFVDVQQMMQKATRDLEGAYLNALPQMFDMGTSAEGLAKLIADRLAAKFGAKLYRVLVTEAPGCVAAYYPGPA